VGVRGEDQDKGYVLRQGGGGDNERKRETIIKSEGEEGQWEKRVT
jgi:hypothetical protein